MSYETANYIIVAVFMFLCSVISVSDIIRNPLMDKRDKMYRAGFTVFMMVLAYVTFMLVIPKYFFNL